MSAVPQPRSWWKQTVSRSKRSGLSAHEFGEAEGVSPRTLAWWSSALRRLTRAERGSTTIAPIEVALPTSEPRGMVEIAVGGAVLRVASGTDVELVRRIGGPFHAARADLLRRLGRADEAREAYARAASLAGSEPERRFLTSRAEA